MHLSRQREGYPGVLYDREEGQWWVTSSCHSPVFCFLQSEPVFWLCIRVGSKHHAGWELAPPQMGPLPFPSSRPSNSQLLHLPSSLLLRSSNSSLKEQAQFNS